MKSFKDFAKTNPKYNKFFVGFNKPEESKKEPVKYNKFFVGFVGKKRKAKIVKEDTEKKNVKIENSFLSEYKKTGVISKDHSDPYTEVNHRSPKHPNLTQQHIRHVNGYTSNSTALNKGLYRNRPLKSLRDMDDHISQTIVRSPKTKMDMHVHSGAGFSPERFEKDKHGNYNVHLPAYTSTSLDVRKAKDFAKSDKKHPKHVAISLNYYSKAKPIAVDAEDHKKAQHFKKQTSKAREGEKIWTRMAGGAYGYKKGLGTAARINLAEKIKQFNKHLKKKYPDLRDEHFSGSDFPKKAEGDLWDSKTKMHETKILNSHEVKHVVHIHIPKGSHAFYAAPISDHQHENEVILHKNAKVRIDGNPTVDNSYVHWHGDLIHDGVKDTGITRRIAVKRFKGL